MNEKTLMWITMIILATSIILININIMNAKSEIYSRLETIESRLDKENNDDN